MFQSLPRSLEVLELTVEGPIEDAHAQILAAGLPRGLRTGRGVRDQGRSLSIAPWFCVRLDSRYLIICA